MNSPPTTAPTLGFLIYDIGRLLRAAMMKRLGDLGLTEAQWRAIAHLTRMQGCRQTDLARALQVRPITLARVIDRLEMAGLVERRQHPDDRRAVSLYLAAGSAPLVSTLRKLSTVLQEHAMQGMEAGDRQRLYAMLLAMRDNLAGDDPILAGLSKQGSEHDG